MEVFNYFMSILFDSASLVNWFKKKKRSFPWRKSVTPYAVWVSEVMLQQTRASVVIPYFEKWMQQFPTIASLAQAPLEKVIKAWEGLGYYSRVRNLHAGAIYVVEKFHGELPRQAEDLKKIKGLGPYTIGAIRNFAFKEKAAAVDGNVLRVLSRYFHLEEDIAKPATRTKIGQMVEAILPEEEFWIFSEALIELGATVCTRKPSCHECPIRSSCQAYAQGTELELPLKSGKKKIEMLERTAFVICCENACLLQKVEKGKIMSDLHEFPYIENSGNHIGDLLNFIKQKWKLTVKFEENFPLVKHSFTRYRVQLHSYRFAAMEKKDVEGYQWITLKELFQLPFSSGHKKILQFLKE